jgi:hypothetical protein
LADEQFPRYTKIFGSTINVLKRMGSYWWIYTARHGSGDQLHSADNPAKPPHFEDVWSIQIEALFSTGMMLKRATTES